MNLPKSPEREEIANVLFYLLKGDSIEGVDSEKFPVLIAEVPTENSFDYIEGRLRDFTHIRCNELEGVDIYRDSSSCPVYESSNKGTVEVTYSDCIQPSSMQKIKTIKEK